MPIHRKELGRRYYKESKPPKSTRWDYKCIECGKPVSRKSAWGGFYGGIPRFCSKKCEREREKRLEKSKIQRVEQGPTLDKAR